MKNIVNWIFINKTKLLLGLLSFLAYGFLLGWKLSIFIVLAIGIHEYGHFLAMQMTNLKSGGIYFIPFFGGATTIKEGYRSYWQHSIVALAGPAIGALLAIFLAVYGKKAHLPIFEAAAWITMALNAFNMIPALPLDGGHWLKCIFFSFRPVVGLSLLSLVCLAIFVISIPILHWWAPTVWIFGLVQLGVEGYYLLKRHDPKYPRMAIPHLLRRQPLALTKMQMVYSLMAYVGICFMLLVTWLLTRNLDLSKLESYF